MTLTRLAPGLYETPDGVTVEHRPDIDGDWYVTYPGRSHPDNVYPRLKDAREALVQRAQRLADEEVATSKESAYAVQSESARRRGEVLA